MQDVDQWIGIDVCKRWLDVHVRPAHQSFRVSNDANGIAQFVKALSVPERVGRIVLE